MSKQRKSGTLIQSTMHAVYDPHGRDSTRGEPILLGESVHASLIESPLQTNLCKCCGVPFAFKPTAKPIAYCPSHLWIATAGFIGRLICRDKCYKFPEGHNICGRQLRYTYCLPIANSKESESIEKTVLSLVMKTGKMSEDDLFLPKIVLSPKQDVLWIFDIHHLCYGKSCEVDYGRLSALIRLIDSKVCELLLVD